MAKNGNIIKYKKPFSLNIGLIILLILFVYIVFSAYSYINKDKVSFYEVTDGGMAKNTEHVGIAIRNELPQISDTSGYLNPLISSGKRISVGDELFAIDSSASAQNSQSDEALSKISLNDSDIDSVKAKVSEFSQNYNDKEFLGVYDAKTSISADVIDYANSATNENHSNNNPNYRKHYSNVAGVVSFGIDGYEDRTIESINENDFNNDIHTLIITRSGNHVDIGQPVCKIVTSENWDIVFPLSKEEEKLFADMSKMLIKFKKNGIKISVPFTQVNSADGHNYGKISLQKYMVDFIDDRFIAFDIDENIVGGLKIPKSAVVEKTFLIVPEEYLTHGGDDFSSGFYRESSEGDGTLVEYIPTEIFNQIDGKLYIDFSSSAEFQPGDIIIKPGSNEKFKIGETAKLSGVYNINKGYAVFKQIEVIDSNDEYYTVRRNQKYGLVVYDHILFNPKGINEGDFIYQ